MSKEYEFWTQVRKTRNLIFLWWIGWLPFGFIGMMIIEALFGKNGGNYIFIILIIWLILGGLFSRRVDLLLCPQCNKPAIQHVLFFMKDAKCRHCGLAYKDLDTK